MDGAGVEQGRRRHRNFGRLFNCESRSNWPNEHVKRQFIIHYFESCQQCVIYKVVDSIGGSLSSLSPHNHSPFDFVINCFTLQF